MLAGRTFLTFSMMNIYVFLVKGTIMSSESQKWRAYVYKPRHPNCIDFIPSDVQEAMNRSHGVIPDKFLYTCLLENYIKDIAPSIDRDKLFNLSYALTINQILSIQNVGYIHLSVQVGFTWIDERLNWENEPKVGNWTWPQDISLSARRVWVPHTEVITCDESDCALRMPNNTRVWLHRDGEAMVTYKSKAKATCNITLEYFPFDRQNCEFIIDVMNLNVNYSWFLNEENMWSYYMDDNSEWTFTDFKLGTNAAIYNTISRNVKDPVGKWRLQKKPFNADVIVVSISAVRQTTYYMTNLIVPLLLVNLVAIASVSFKPGSCERPSTLLTVILAYSFFQSIVAAVLPHSREDSLIGLYLMWAMVSATAQLLVSFLLIALNTKSENGNIPPVLLQKIFIRFPKLLVKLFRINGYCKTTDNVKNNPAQAAASHDNEEIELSEINKIYCAKKSESQINDNIVSPPKVNSDKSDISAECIVALLAGYFENNSHGANCGNKSPTNNKGDGWEEIANSINWISGVSFVALNLLLFIKFIWPLLMWQIFNSFLTKYLIDEGPLLK